MAADAETGRMQQGRWTLSGTPGTVTKINLPDNTRGVRVRPIGTASEIVIFAIGEDPAAEGAGTFAVGNVAIAGESAEVRVPGASDNSGNPRTLRLRSTTASLPVIVEIF